MAGEARLTVDGHKDLGKLIHEGATSLKLRQCDGLMAAIERHIGVRPDAPQEVRADLLKEVLSRVFQEAFDWVKREYGQIWSMREHASCQLLAAAELIGLSSPAWDETFNAIGRRLVKERRNNDIKQPGDEQAIWESICNKSENAGASKRFFRAGVWVGALSAQTGRRWQNRNNLIAPLETALTNYLGRTTFVRCLSPGYEPEVSRPRISKMTSRESARVSVWVSYPDDARQFSTDHFMPLPPSLLLASTADWSTSSVSTRCLTHSPSSCAGLHQLISVWWITRRT